MSEYLEQASIAAKYLIKTHYIMKVIEFHPETQTVDVVQDVFEFTNAPMGTIEKVNDFGRSVVVGLRNPDIIYNVPVKQLRWGQFEIQCCPVPGDTGYIEVFANDIRDWVDNGSLSIPWSDRHFVKESCVFVPFIPNHVNASQDYPLDNTSLVIKSMNASIKITDKPAEEGSEEEPIVDITTTAQTININAEKGITVTGDVNITGNITVTGEVNVDGTISVTKDIKSDGDINAGGVSLQNHTHTVPAGTAISTSQGPGTITGPMNVPAPDKQGA